jgi:hypothetical protein
MATTARNALRSLRSIGRLLFAQLPERPYPSDHPWEHRHDPARPRG